VMNFQLGFNSKEACDAAERLLLLYQQGTTMSEEIAKIICLLWVDNAIQTVYEMKGKKYQLNDTAEYFFENVERISKDDYIPSDDDILRARQRTTGGDTYSFEEEKTIWELTDVGGQFSERQKWTNYCEENEEKNQKPPHAVIFFLALDEYNIPNVELRTEEFATKFELAINVFTELLCSAGPVLDHKMCRLVFLNKIDLFQDIAH